MIKAKIEWTSVRYGNPTLEDPFEEQPKAEQDRRISVAGIKEFSNEKEMLDYCFSVYKYEIIIEKQYTDEGIDYDIELWNWYRE